MVQTEAAALSVTLATSPSPEGIGTLPPYVDAFLAHLRLLVGVPFHYLVPDARLLPPDSIRFFYLDRSWTDRMVEGAMAVGGIASRERAHTAAVAPSVQRTLDDSERLVRELQRRRIDDFKTRKDDPDRDRAEAGTITGFVMRSGLVSGWPHLEVRGLLDGAALPILRLERLSPGVLIVLWEGVPDRVELEEPHHSVQFGVEPQPNGSYRVVRRNRAGTALKEDGQFLTAAVPMRTGGRSVVHVTELRKRLAAGTANDDTHPVPQSGPAALAVALLDPPMLQPFQGAGEIAAPPTLVGARIADTALRSALKLLIGSNSAYRSGLRPPLGHSPAPRPDFVDPEARK